ncbi:putative membrane protein [Halorhabdus sp. SVX81]|nr:putative membrane protein [Halorhabdus sp. SVX81]WEL20197.1 putative membrane protein [Halorhabdus sp. BNX81]
MIDMSLDVEDLLKIVLLLVVVLIVLEIVGMVIDGIAWLLGPFRPLLGLIIVVLIVLWLLDRI